MELENRCETVNSMNNLETEGEPQEREEKKRGCEISDYQECHDE